MKDALQSQTLDFDYIKKEYNNLFPQWEKVKKVEKFPFYKYTDDLFEKIRKILSTSNIFLLGKAFGYLNEVREIHLQGKLDYDYIRIYADDTDKIYWFNEYNNLFTDEEYWQNLIIAYQLQYYDPNLPHGILKSLFSSKRGGKESIMDKDKRRVYDGLPDVVTIYRGMSVKEFNSGDFRLSWTLDKNIAEEFKERSELLYGQKSMVHELKIDKAKILAYLNDEEQEVIVIF
ncbi:hypothetical protein HZQ22_16050 [Elizabethkingia anophelis]|uniref:Uncharacterized protein n=1 Tax=Elizabethkingia anophelis TaxID=1117645 RepID=A0AAE4P1H3_9FLAO|nr:hypothetical protein [Elizabethkingia anophelis]MCT4006869.1 hypothetical protein [Elizabethkingia anophelis]MDV3579519.1 hypothetical protein [Elizabethkingia anophelis]MDV3664204.1 hypothetical protein [Elizabethkingia anophelis]MYZ58437.1 hypothetical protein [Elizabethkingia anophelis]